jgi:hypothetical protein
LKGKNISPTKNKDKGKHQVEEEKVEMDLRSSKESDNLIFQLISPKNDKGGKPPKECKS